jgi:hypothetical protein
MSYSFNFVVASKEAAKARVAEEFDNVVKWQPIHARDRAAVLANANAVIDLLEDKPDQDVSVSSNGYLSWEVMGNDDPNATPLTGVAITTSAHYVPRKA